MRQISLLFFLAEEPVNHLSSLRSLFSHAGRCVGSELRKEHRHLKAPGGVVFCCVCTGFFPQASWSSLTGSNVRREG
jgi:hypothetical protein